MQPSRILVVRLGSMGDVIHALPAVASLKRSFPNARMSWVIRERWAPLLAGNPHVDELIPYDRTFTALLALRRRLRGQHFDLAIDLQGLIQSALIARASGAPKIVGFAHAAEKPSSWLYSDAIAT